MAGRKRRYDLILRGGRVIDPASGRNRKADLGIADGRIAAVKAGIKGAKRVIDVSGALVLPGLIDTHAHVYRHVTGAFGLDADLCGVRSGVTTVVDQGGPSLMTLAGFRKFIVEPAETRVLCFLSTYTVGGLEGHRYPSLYGPEQVDVKRTAEIASANRDIVKGIKAHAEVGGASRWGCRVLERAREIAGRAKLPVYVHLGQLWPTEGTDVDADAVVRDMVPLMKKGDILAHPFTRHPGGFISAKTGKLHPAVRKAVARGVRVDVGHGAHFSFRMARAALEQGIRPFSLGADLHGYSIAVPEERAAEIGLPANDRAPFGLCHAMTELLALGMGLDEVVATATSNAALAIGMADELGSLARGRAADVSVVDLVPGPWALRDNSGETVRAEHAVVPRFALRDGVRHDADSPLLPALDAAA